MAEPVSISASEFKAKCLELLDRVGRRELTQLTITKRGKPVAVVSPPAAKAAEVEELHGFLRGSVVIPAGLDLTAPTGDEPFLAAEGELHQ